MICDATGYPDIMRPINGPVSSVKGVPHEPSPMVKNIPWYLSEVLNIDINTDFIAQVAQTCHHPVTKTLGNCISITAYHNPNSLHTPVVTNDSLASLFPFDVWRSLNMPTHAKGSITETRRIFPHN
jgi:hypothetical protein